jgi:ribosomal protein S18 acetylase RimI-like enzyme
MNARNENQIIRLYEISGKPDFKTLSGFDASYSSEYAYRVAIDGMDVTIREEKLPAPIHKTYALKDIEESVSFADHTIIAEVEGRTAGFAALKYEKWNRRVHLIGLYVAPAYKGRGIGTALVQRGVEYAKTAGARCLWLETQNINHPAIQFYLRSGFRFCGFDTSLYNPGTVLPGEIALYFALEIAS